MLSPFRNSWKRLSSVSMGAVELTPVWRLGQYRSFAGLKANVKTRKQDFSQVMLKKVKKHKKIKHAPYGSSSKPNQDKYKDLVFKWLLEAYPESLSRQEISGRLKAHPQKVKALIIQPLCKEGRIFKWGQKAAPLERYMPNVKAPEYYAVTGETVPSMPSIDEKAFMSALRRPSEKPPKNINGTIDAASRPDAEERKQPSKQPEDKEEEVQSWTDLYTEPNDDEDYDDDDFDDDDTDDEDFGLPRETSSDPTDDLDDETEYQDDYVTTADDSEDDDSDVSYDDASDEDEDEDEENSDDTEFEMSTDAEARSKKQNKNKHPSDRNRFGIVQPPPTIRGPLDPFSRSKPPGRATRYDKASSRRATAVASSSPGQKSFQKQAKPRPYPGNQKITDRTVPHDRFEDRRASPGRQDFKTGPRRDGDRKFFDRSRERPRSNPSPNGQKRPYKQQGRPNPPPNHQRKPFGNPRPSPSGRPPFKPNENFKKISGSPGSNPTDREETKKNFSGRGRGPNNAKNFKKQ